MPPFTNDSANQFTSENFLNVYGVFMPQKRREMLDFQDEEYFSLDIFSELKMSEPVNGREFSFFIAPKKVLNLVAVSAVAAGATNATVDIVIKNTVGISGGVFARGREVLRRKNGQQVVVYAVNKSTSTITVKAKVGANVLAVSANEVFAVIGNVSPEASKPRNPITGVPREIFNQLQIAQEYAEASGSVQEDKLWMEVAKPNMDGTTSKQEYWFSYEIQAAWDRLTNQRANTLLAGKKETYDITGFETNFTDKGITTMYTSSSVIDQYVAEGNQRYYTIGTLNMAWYNGLENIQIKNYGDRENLMFAGIDFSHQNNAWLIDMMKNGAITYGAFNNSASVVKDQADKVENSKMTSGEALALKMGFKSFTSPTGFTWHWKSLCEFNAPDGLGEIGFSQNYLVIPTQPIRTTTKSKLTRPVRLRYKNLPNGGQVGIGFRNSVRNSSTPNSAGDFDGVEMLLEEGPEVLAPWKGLFGQPQ